MICCSGTVVASLMDVGGGLARDIGWPADMVRQLTAWPCGSQLRAGLSRRPVLRSSAAGHICALVVGGGWWCWWWCWPPRVLAVTCRKVNLLFCQAFACCRASAISNATIDGRVDNPSTHAPSRQRYYPTNYSSKLSTVVCLGQRMATQTQSL